jgi:hypothetical protein
MAAEGDTCLALFSAIFSQSTTFKTHYKSKIKAITSKNILIMWKSM